MGRSSWPLLAWFAVGALAMLIVLLISRSGGPRYCKRCEIAVVQEVQDERPRRSPRCVLNGREIDCSKVPGQCPDCGQ